MQYFIQGVLVRFWIQILWGFSLLPTAVFASSFKQPLQIAVDKTLQIRSSGVFVRQAFYFSSKSANLTGVMDTDCTWNIIGKARGMLNVTLYLNNYRMIDQTSSSMAPTQQLQIKFKALSDCEAFLKAVESVDVSNDNRFQMTIESNQISFSAQDFRKDWPLLEVGSKIQTRHP